MAASLSRTPAGAPPVQVSRGSIPADSASRVGATAPFRSTGAACMPWLRAAGAISTTRVSAGHGSRQPMRISMGS